MLCAWVTLPLRCTSSAKPRCADDQITLLYKNIGGCSELVFLCVSHFFSSMESTAGRSACSFALTQVSATESVVGSLHQENVTERKSRNGMYAQLVLCHSKDYEENREACNVIISLFVLLFY